MIDNRTKSIPTSSSEVGIYYVYISQGNKDNGVYIVSDFVLPITVTKIAELYIGDNTKANLNGGNTFTGDQVINGDITVEDITANNFLGNASTATKLKTFVNINGVAFDGSSNITIYDSTKEATISVGTVFQYFRGDKTWQTLNKIVVGLSNVDNTADANKNVLSATKLTIPRTINNVSFDGSENIVINAVDSTPRIPMSYMGIANGVATLDNTGIIPITQLPSYVDDVIEVANYASLPIIGESGKIYVTTNNNKTYRWSGSVYVYITSGAVDSVNGYTGVVVLTKSDFILGNVDNTSDANKPISIATQGALDLKQNLLTLGNFTSTTPGITISNGNGAVIGSGITFNITTAGTTTGGLITSGHWNTFNNKWDSSNHPITTLGYGLPDYPTTLPASDVYSWAKQSTKPTYSYSEIISKPTLLSQFTNDLGNYGSWITGINSGMVTTALGYTPLPTRTFGTAANNNTGDFYAAGSTVANSSLLEGHNASYFQVAGSYAPASGSGNYIQNNNTSAQSANMWISGSIRTNGADRFIGNSVGVLRWIERTNSNQESTGNLGSNYELIARADDGSSLGSYFSILRATGAATFASTVNATQLQSTIATGTAPLTVNSTTMVGNLNAQYLKNMPLISTGNNFDGIPCIQSDGVMEVGKYIDFHETNTGTEDYVTRVTSSGSGNLLINDNTIYHSGNLTNNLSTNYIPKWNGSSFVNSLISDAGIGNGVRMYTGQNTPDISYGVGKGESPGNAVYFGWKYNSGDPYGFIETYSGGAKLCLNNGGLVTIPSLTQSSSPTTGALVVGGGIGVGGGMGVGGQIVAQGNIFGQSSIYTNLFVSSGSEGLRMNNSAAYLSGFNTAGTLRQGYLQFNANDITLQSESGSKTFIINPASGNTTIGYTTDQGYKLAVNGNIKGDNYIGKSNGFYTVQITQAAYIALGTKDASTIYMIVG